MSSTPTHGSDRLGGSRAVLVVGASGFLGRSVVRALCQGGYEARGLLRDPLKEVQVREDGGTAVLGDVLDARSLRAAAKGCVGIIHLAANPSTGGDPARVRVEGTRNLVAAAQRAGVLRLVVGSGYWVYEGQAGLIDEETPVEPHGESQVNYDAEQAGLESNSPGRLEVMVVRPGMVYGNGSWFRGMAESIRSGKYRIAGPGTNRWSFVDLEDAGRAFRAVLDSGEPGQVYNAVDGHPESLGDFVAFVAGQLRVPTPRAIPLEEAKRQMGEVIARHLSADRPVSNRKLANLGWKPMIASYHAGIPRIVREMFPA
jgi:nucleoside-diphosphate-sugar epimerase